MTQDKLVSFKTPDEPGTFSDALTELVRKGARQIIAQTVEVEWQEFLAQYQNLKDEQGPHLVEKHKVFWVDVFDFLPILYSQLLHTLCLRLATA